MLGPWAARAAADTPWVELRQGVLEARAAGDAAPAAPETVALPWRVYRPSLRYTRYRLAVPFDVPAALVATRTTLALDSWPDGGRITINGTEVVDIGTSSPERVVRQLRPFAFNLPAGLLRERGNELVMEWGSGVTLVLVPRPYIGAREALEPLIERKLFWEHTVVPGSTVFAAVILLVTGAVWWQQRRRGTGSDYGLFVLSAFGWIVFNTSLLWSTVPAAWFVERRALGFLGVGLFVFGMWAGLVRLAQGRAPRYEAVGAAWLAAGPVMALGAWWVLGTTHEPRAEAAWAAGGALLGLVPLLLVPRAAWRQRTPRLLLLAVFVAVAVVLAAREAAIYILRDPIGTVHLGLQLLAPLWLAVAAGVLVQDFVQAARAAVQERAEVDRKLAEREAELRRLHERERELAAVAERQRIMQDMHDGLGSQLISSLSMAERGQLGPAQTAELLRGCIDDLRLAIDTLTEADVNLAVTAGDLRFRMEPRLRAAGLKLRWDMAALPDALQIPGSIALPVLRVLQESLSNAVKHSGAQQVQVRLAAEGGALVLEVADDGRGLPAERRARGKGLAGMEKRARGLGAELQVGAAGPDGGTRVRLAVPLAR